MAMERTERMYNFTLHFGALVAHSSKYAYGFPWAARLFLQLCKVAEVQRCLEVSMSFLISQWYMISNQYLGPMA